MEEIGHRTDVLTFDGLGNEPRAYLDWLLGECIAEDVENDSVIEPAALDLMAQRLRTPLQFAEHLNRAFEAGLCTGQKPITADIVTLSPDFDDLEPRLTGLFGEGSCGPVPRRWRSAVSSTASSKRDGPASLPSGCAPQA